MTISYRLALETTAVVHCASTRAAGGTAEALPYIPGSALRGALAARLLQRFAPESAEFERFSADVRVGNILPAVNGALSVPAPLSTVSSNRAPGSVSDGGSGVSDLLLLSEALSLRHDATNGDDRPSGPPDDDNSEAPTRPRPSRGRQRVAATPWSGFLSWQDGALRAVDVRFDDVITQRVSETRRTSGGDGVYRRGLAAGQQLAGEIAFPDETMVGVVTAELAPVGTTLWVGSDRARGLGSVVTRGWDRVERTNDAGSRRAGLEDQLRTLCEQTQASPPDDGRYFTLTLQSPAILRDAFGRYRQRLDSAAMASLCRLPGESVAVRQAFVATAAVEGWNAALSLPKPDALALVAGSCWLVRVAGVDAATLDETLARLEHEGVGERRQEGFGVLTCCDPLHWRVHEVERELERTQ